MIEMKDETKDKRIEAGQSRRIWDELFKVLDSSDVVIQVLDSRDPDGTRSKYIEEHLKKNAPHKHMIFLLNKVDLIPTWVTVQFQRTWLTSLGTLGKVSIQDSADNCLSCISD
jgi:nuclear GTP-binding protein